MKRIGKYAVMAAMIGLFSACLEDNNNYNYKEINKLDGAILNLPDEKSLVKGEEWLIAPEFKFTIDKENPDVSYEWYVDKVLQEGETGPTFKFKSEKHGYILVTFVVKDNKSGVRFSKSSKVFVSDVFLRGWTILSDDNGRSVLHFIKPSTLSYPSIFEEEEFTRDSIVYHDVMRDVAPGLGNNPKGLISNFGYNDYQNDYNMQVFDELIVKQDRWAELNGNTFEREVYTDEEFHGDVPENFEPVEAAMTFSAKAVLDKSGLIYWGKKGDVVDFHANSYVSIGLNGDTKFARLFESIKLNTFYNNIVLALRAEDNSLVGILNNASVKGWQSSAIPENLNGRSGELFELDDANKGNGGSHFANLQKTVVDVISSPYSEYDGYEPESFWVMLLKDEQTSSYDLCHFKLDFKRDAMVCPKGYYIESSLGTISNFKSITNFGMKHYVVIADGNQLYYAQYGWDNYSGAPIDGKLMKLGDPLPAPVKKLASHDVNVNTYVCKYPYDGQLGVALEDGSFYIFNISEIKDKLGKTTEVSMKQLYPNEKTSEDNKKFGTIVDVLYKHGLTDYYLNFGF